jgi:anti-sigma factor RsiW
MSEHDSIRKLLPLAASGDLAPEDLRLVRDHLMGCESCSRVSEELVAIGGALRGLPTPQPRAELVARVRDLAERRLRRKRAWSREAAILAPLVAGSWIMAAATWPLTKAASLWLLTGWQVPVGGIWSALANYSIIGFLLACVSAFAVGRRARTIGRT